MIKIRIAHLEFTLNDTVWNGENQNIADMLTSISADRPFRYERSREWAIANYIVDFHKERYGAEIIYDSEDGKLEERMAPYD